MLHLVQRNVVNISKKDSTLKIVFSTNSNCTFMKKPNNNVNISCNIIFTTRKYFDLYRNIVLLSSWYHTTIRSFIFWNCSRFIRTIELSKTWRRFANRGHLTYHSSYYSTQVNCKGNINCILRNVFLVWLIAVYYWYRWLICGMTWTDNISINIRDNKIKRDSNKDQIIKCHIVCKNKQNWFEGKNTNEN